MSNEITPEQRKKLRDHAEWASEHGPGPIEVLPDDIMMALDALETAERRIAELETRPCPHVIVTTEGTGYCALAEKSSRAAQKERDELRGRLEAAEKKVAAYEPASLEWTRVVRAATDDGPHAMPLETDVADWVREMRERLEAAERERDEWKREAEGYNKALAELDANPEARTAVLFTWRGKEIRVFGPTPKREADFCKVISETLNLAFKEAAEAECKKKENALRERDTAREQLASVAMALGCAIDTQEAHSAESRTDRRRLEKMLAFARGLREERDAAREDAARLREVLAMVMAAPAYCSCSPESGCKAAVAREAARAAFAATEPDAKPAPAPQECAECARLRSLLGQAFEFVDSAVEYGPDEDGAGRKLRANILAAFNACKSPVPAPIASESHDAARGGE